LIPTHAREHGCASFSEARDRRSHLTRMWRTAKDPGSRGTLCWIGLNPSIAGADTDDPTIRRIRGFTKREDYDGFVMLNLSTFIATEPRDLFAALDRGTADTMDRAADLIRWLAPHVAGFVAAWGASVEAHHQMTHRAIQLGGLLESLAHTHNIPLLCLGRTRQGHPRHPLYLAASTPFEPWGAR